MKHRHISSFFRTSFPNQHGHQAGGAQKWLGRQLGCSETEDTLTRQKTRADCDFTATAQTVAAANEAPALPTVSHGC